MHILWLNALLKGILEGITEFLPISSTGHLVLVRDFLPLGAGLDAQALKVVEDAFDIVIQFPAILAIMVLYRKRLWQAARGVVREPASRRFWTVLLISFAPAAVIGFLGGDWVEAHLFRPSVIAAALVVGGIAILAIERWMPSRGELRPEEMRSATALGIGFFQCLALIPGTSRSAATILGGRFLGLSRESAAEYSFFLALPTLGAACAYKSLSTLHLIDWSTYALPFAIGGVASFVTAYLVVAWFIRFLQTRTLSAFGWYRIGLGLLVFAVLSRSA